MGFSPRRLRSRGRGFLSDSASRGCGLLGNFAAAIYLICILSCVGALDANGWGGGGGFFGGSMGEMVEVVVGGGLGKNGGKMQQQFLWESAQRDGSFAPAKRNACRIQ
ncbi:hypothetical protein RJ640_007589 [Escallonia rubra]|uniref:Uncharacterized protein n=1 Tax=Escallonia rubra TaxID=112253 RepID=A0AA88R4J3_9ASTE|nr:hypothetical protein RJ640_007589 [Escallonia rubra]